MPCVVLLQSDPAVGLGLRKAIASEAGLQVRAVTQTLAQTRVCIERGGVDLLVADLHLVDGRLIDLMRELRGGGRADGPLVLAVAMSAENPHLMQALRHGAHGYFIHGSTGKSLAGVIGQMLAGESPMSPSIARRLKAHFAGHSLRAAHRNPREVSVLTETERQMLNRVSEGYLMHEIAREMQTTVHSVGLRSRSLYRKLQLDLCAEAHSRLMA